MSAVVHHFDWAEIVRQLTAPTPYSDSYATLARAQASYNAACTLGEWRGILAATVSLVHAREDFRVHHESFVRSMRDCIASTPDDHCCTFFGIHEKMREFYRREIATSETVYELSRASPSDEHIGWVALGGPPVRERDSSPPVCGPRPGYGVQDGAPREQEIGLPERGWSAILSGDVELLEPPPGDATTARSPM